MAQVPFVLLLALMFVLIIIKVIYAQKKADERRAALLSLSSDQDFEFYPEGLSTDGGGTFFQEIFGLVDSPQDKFLEAFQGFTPFGEGHSPAVNNLIVGRKEGLDWFIFDYDYRVTRSTGKSTTTTTYENGVVAVRLPLMLVCLRFGPEGFFDRVFEKFGRAEIELESEEFNQTYFVQSNDKKGTYDLLHPKMMEYLLSIPTRNWQIAGPFIVLTQNRYFEPAEIRQLMSELQAFVNLIPNYVRQDRRVDFVWQNPLDGMS